MKTHLIFAQVIAELFGILTFWTKAITWLHDQFGAEGMLLCTPISGATQRIRLELGIAGLVAPKPKTEAARN